MSELLCLLGIFIRAVATLPFFSGVQYLDPLRYCASTKCFYPNFFIKSLTLDSLFLGMYVPVQSILCYNIRSYCT